MDLLYIFSILVTGIFIKLDGIKIVKEQSIIKYKKWKALNKLVSTTYKNDMEIIWVSIKLCFFALYIELLQYLNKSVQKVKKNTYDFSYVIEGKLYKYRIKVKRGPNPILQISNENSEDITEIILPYLGPENNWHGANLTPNILGYKSLIFQLADSNERQYSYDDIIDSF
jgi:hypothetical protein